MATLPSVPVRVIAVSPNGDPPKSADPEKRLLITRVWILWFETVRSALNAMFNQASLPVSLTAHAASIGATDIATGLAGGVYRVSYYTRVSRAASTSSSLQVQIVWTDGAVVQTYTGAALVGNTTTTMETGTMLVRADAGTAVQYVVTYGSVGATTMTYSLDVRAEGAP